MVKSSVLEFHETFQPEMTYIAKMLKLDLRIMLERNLKSAIVPEFLQASKREKLSPIFATHASWDWWTTP